MSIDIKLKDGWPPEPQPETPMTDQEIEGENKRQRLPRNAAYLAITLCPGTNRLGEFHVNVQYEGKSGQTDAEKIPCRDTCIDGHNALLGEVSDLIHDLLAELGGDWTGTLHTKHNPASKQVDREGARRVLERGRTASAKVTGATNVSVTPVVETKRDMDPGTK